MRPTRCRASSNGCGWRRASCRRSDFLSLADGLARSLGPVPVNGIAGLDYRDRRLEVTFKPETKVDPDLAEAPRARTA